VTSIKPLPAEESKISAETEELLNQLGPFRPIVDVEKEKFMSVLTIKDWKPLMSRYKPEWGSLIQKAINSPQLFEKKWVHPDWKEVLTDKKEGLVVW
jgi:hypothetical protein